MHILHEIDDMVLCNLPYDTDSIILLKSLKKLSIFLKCLIYIFYNLGHLMHFLKKKVCKRRLNNTIYWAFFKFSSGSRRHMTVEERLLYSHHQCQNQVPLGTTTLVHSYGCMIIFLVRIGLNGYLNMREKCSNLCQINKNRSFKKI